MCRTPAKPGFISRTSRYGARSGRPTPRADRRKGLISINQTRTLGKVSKFTRVRPTILRPFRAELRRIATRPNEDAAADMEKVSKVLLHPEVRYWNCPTYAPYSPYFWNVSGCRVETSIWAHTQCGYAEARLSRNRRSLWRQDRWK